MKNLTKEEVKATKTEDLNIRFHRILERAETLKAEDIPISDARDILLIEDELRVRAITAVGHDFYPPGH